jgi:hypothetical protein
MLGNNILNIDDRYPAASVLLSSFTPSVYDSNTDAMVNWSFFGFQDNLIIGNNTLVGNFDNYTFGVYDWAVSGSRFKLFPEETSGVADDWYTVDNYNYQYGLALNNVIVGHNNADKLLRSSNVIFGNNNLNNAAILADVFTDNTASGKFVTKADDQYSRDILGIAWNPGDVLAYPSQYLSMDPYTAKDILLFGFNQLNDTTASNAIIFGKTMQSASVVSNLINFGYENFLSTAYSRNDIVFGNNNLLSSTSSLTQSDSYQNIVFGNSNIDVVTGGTVTSSYIAGNIVLGQHALKTISTNPQFPAAVPIALVKNNIVLGNNTATDIGYYAIDNIFIGSGILNEVSGVMVDEGLPTLLNLKNEKTVNNFIIGDLAANAITYKPDIAFNQVGYTQLQFLQTAEYGFTFDRFYSTYVGHGVTYSGSLDINTVVIGNKSFVSQSSYDTNNIIIGYKAGRSRAPQYAYEEYDPMNPSPAIVYQDYPWFETRTDGPVLIKEMPGNPASSVTESSAQFQSDTLRDSIVLGNLSLYNTRFYQRPVKNVKWFNPYTGSSDIAVGVIPNASIIAIGERALSNVQYDFDSSVHSIAIGAEIGHDENIIAVDGKLYDSIVVGAKSAATQMVSHSIVIGANTLHPSRSLGEFFDGLRALPLGTPAPKYNIQDSIVIGSNNVNLTGSLSAYDGSDYWIDSLIENIGTEYNPDLGNFAINGFNYFPTITVEKNDESRDVSEYINNIVIGNNTLLSRRYFKSFAFEDPGVVSTTNVTLISDGKVKDSIFIGDSVATKLYLGEANTLIGNYAGFRMQSAYNSSFFGFGIGVLARSIQQNAGIGYHEFSGIIGVPVQKDTFDFDEFTTITGIEFVDRLKDYATNPNHGSTIFGYESFKNSSAIFRESALGAFSLENKRIFRLYTATPIVNGNLLILLQPNAAPGARSLSQLDKTYLASDVAVGYKAASENAAGFMNVHLGADTDYFDGNADGVSINGIVIGYGATRSNRNMANEITIGNPEHTAARLMGANGWWYVQSDIRDKTATSSIDFGLEFIDKLNPKTYKWDPRYLYTSGSGSDGTYSSSIYSVGFIAQDISESVALMGETVIPYWYYSPSTTANFDRTTTYEKLEVATDNLIYPLVNSIKQLSNKFEATDTANIAGNFTGEVQATELTVNTVTMNKVSSLNEYESSDLLNYSEKYSLLTVASNNQPTPTMSIVLASFGEAQTDATAVNVARTKLNLVGLNNNGISVDTAAFELEVIYSITGNTISILTSNINQLHNALNATIQIQSAGSILRAIAYPQNNDWNYQSYTGTYSVGASVTSVTPDIIGSGKIYRPQ